MYFQGLRWRNPERVNELKKCAKIDGILKAPKLYDGITGVTLLVGTLVFNKVEGADTWPDTIKGKVELVLENSLYEFEVYRADANITGFRYCLKLSTSK